MSKKASKGIIYIKSIDLLPISKKQKKQILAEINGCIGLAIANYGLHPQEIYCPHCNFNKAGATTFQGELFNPCDPGCCCTLECRKCGRRYSLQEEKKTK